MNLRQRVARLEGASPANTYEADAAEFERIIERLAARMQPVDAEEARKAWAIGREMLRDYPGFAEVFAARYPEDYRL